MAKPSLEPILESVWRRPDPEGGYELVAGHRRHRASELVEKETMPVIVRNLDDDAATIIMVEMLMETMDYEQATSSLSQAQRMKKFSQDGKVSKDVMLAIMSEEKRRFG